MLTRPRRYAEMAVDAVIGLRPPPRRGKGVLVLGMHRSGTSAITSLIGQLGPDVGDRAGLIAPSEANEKGYWEIRTLTEFQESLLEKLGGGWDAPPGPRLGWERDWRLIRRLGLARRTFSNAYRGAEQWVWKDPRTVLLLPFWRRALRFDPIIVGIFRNPLEVADSLAVRDGMPRKQALGLWETYNRALLENARGLPAFITSYEDLLHDPGAIARELGTFLNKHGLTVRRPASGVVRSSVDVDLRHNVHTRAGTEAADDLTNAQRALFEELHEVRGEHSPFRGLKRSGQPGLARGRQA